MNENIHQVRQDLEIIRSAAGFGQPPLGREDTWALRLLGCFGLLWAVAAWVAGGLPLQWFTIFALTVSLVGVIAYHFKYTRASERTVTRDRVYRGSWRLAAVLGLLIGAFYVWAKFFGGLQGATFMAATAFFSGSLLIILAITDRWRLCFWGWAVPILIFGGTAGLMSETVLAVMLGVAIGIGGFASAAILSWQLRQERA